jgi:hypothetical protein
MASSRPPRTAADTAKRYRALAEATYRLADECDCPDIIDDYLRIAVRLNKFAEEAEALADVRPSKATSQPKAKACTDLEPPPAAHP